MNKKKITLKKKKNLAVRIGTKWSHDCLTLKSAWKHWCGIVTWMNDMFNCIISWSHWNNWLKLLLRSATTDRCMHTVRIWLKPKNSWNTQTHRPQFYFAKPQRYLFLHVLYITHSYKTTFFIYDGQHLGPKESVCPQEPDVLKRKKRHCM